MEFLNVLAEDQTEPRVLILEKKKLLNNKKMQTLPGVNVKHDEPGCSGSEEQTRVSGLFHLV